MITVSKVNETYIRVAADRGILQELSDYFQFDVPGARWTPKFKAKLWDGKIRLFNMNTSHLYTGLLPALKIFAENNEYPIAIDARLASQTTATLDQVKDYVDSLNLYGHGEKLIARDYQYDAILNAVNKERIFLLSPTASGKSMMIYSLLRYHLAHGRKCLIVVPTTGLVEQMYGDFIDYSSENGWSVEDNCQILYSGFTKEFSKNILISTWQSIFRQPAAWLNQFDVAFGDECLHPDSEISMANGTKKPISEIQVGDIVLTYNEKTFSIEPKPVLNIHKNLSVNEQMFKVKLSNGLSIKITGNHKVLLVSGFWKRADNLEIGDCIRCEVKVEMVKKGLVVTGITPIDYTEDVYNLHIEDNHNYFADNVNVSNCHLFKAKSLTSIMEKMTDVRYRIGTTGTIDDKLVHKLVLEGLFGPVYQVTTTKQLMTDKHVTNLKIKCLVLKHEPEVCALMKKVEYKDEIKFIVTNQKRNEFIAKLAVACEGNTLVLFQYVNNHGKPLFDLISKKAGNARKVFFISGSTDVEVRESVRSSMSDETNAIIVASFGTTSTGVNIPSIENIIFASPTKSKIRNLQSIGRGLRLNQDKEFCSLFDIGDDLSYKKYVNHTFKHLEERCLQYATEKFDFKILEIPL